MLSRAELRRAWRELVAAGTGFTQVEVSRTSSAPIAGLPTVAGEWNFPEHTVRTTMRAVYPKEGHVTVTTVVVDRSTFAQALYDGSIFAPDCWTRVTEADATWVPPGLVPVVSAQTHDAPGVHAGNASASLADVLAAIGFQKLVSTAAGDLGAVRLDVSIEVLDGSLRGWTVTGAAIDDALADLPASAVDGSVRQLFTSLRDATWDVAILGLGQPVEVEEPAADRLLDASHRSCRP
ncbi:hypothetical protein [Nocardioides aquiterrae]|uniref:hypothetical protein n=1 Tax=Nocardioides aquiterrae TaxID=203799 RepID=UPI0031D866AC